MVLFGVRTLDTVRTMDPDTPISQQTKIQILLDGRRPVYLLALPIYVIASFGVALSAELWHLAVMRTLQGLGTSCFVSTGIATISDIFKLEERGRAMGIYTSVRLPCSNYLSSF